MDEAHEMYRTALTTGMGFIALAKRAHDEMETYYSPHMDFDAIARKRQEILERVLELGSLKLRELKAGNGSGL
jgi:hypothetical protein